MKIHTLSKETFNPITLSITFESADEFNTFQWTMAHDKSIPQIIYSENPASKALLSDTMGKIHDAMSNTK